MSRGKTVYYSTVSKESNRILNGKRTKVIDLGCYDYPNGRVYLAKTGKGRIVKITHDGTGNEFFKSHAPEDLTESNAQEILARTFNFEDYAKNAMVLGLPILTEDDYIYYNKQRSTGNIGRWD